MIQPIYPLVSLFLPDSFLEQSLDQVNGTVRVADMPTHLTRRVSQAQAKPIKLLQSDELCTLLRQREGGVAALALALHIVGAEPLVCADASPGDLLRLTLEYAWDDWIAAQRFGIDPWVSLLDAQATLAGLREALAAMDTLCAGMEDASAAQPRVYLPPDPQILR